MASLSLLGFIIKPIGINNVCLAEYCSGVIGAFRGKRDPNVVLPALQSFGENTRPKFRIMAKQPSFLHGESRTLREYRIAGFELACFLVVQHQQCYPC
jgi:hypothetical protein